MLYLDLYLVKMWKCEKCGKCGTDVYFGKSSLQFLSNVTNSSLIPIN